MNLTSIIVQLLAFFALVGVLSAQSQTSTSDSINPGDEPTDPPKPCCDCEYSSESEQESLHFVFPLGRAHYNRPTTFTKISRSGIIEGKRHLGPLREFSDFYETFFSPDSLARHLVQLEFHVAEISADLYHPSILRLHNSGEVERVNDTSGTAPFIKQILSDTVLTHIELLDSSLPANLYGSGVGFRMRSWNRAHFDAQLQGGEYVLPTTEDPYNEIIFRKPVGASGDNELEIVYLERFGATGVHEVTEHFVRDLTADTQVMNLHLGIGTSGPVLERESLAYSARGAKVWDRTILRERWIAATTDGLGTPGALKLVDRCQEVYLDFSLSAGGGELGKGRLMSKVRDFGGEDLTTTYTYHEDASNSYLHGRPFTIENPDGSWRRYEYLDSATTNTPVHTLYSSWKDIPLSNYQAARKTETTITANEIVKVTSIAGQQISRTEVTKEYLGQSDLLLTSRNWTGSEWETTLTCLHSDSASLGQRGRIRWRQNADGIYEVYTYDLDADGLTITCDKGAGDENGITSGTRMIQRYNMALKLVESRTLDLPTMRLQDARLADVNQGVDNLGRPIHWIHADNPVDTSITQYGCCGLEFQRDRSGATTTYFKDGLRRDYKIVRQRSSGGPLVTTLIHHDGLRRETRLVSSAGDLLVSDVTESLSGLTEITLSPDADGDANPETTTRTTVYLTAGGSTTTTSYPDGTSTSSTTFIDGNRKSFTDQENDVTIYDIDTHTEEGGGLVTQVTQPGGTQWTKSYTDQLGRTFKMEYPDGVYSQTSYYGFAESIPVGFRGGVSSTLDPDETANVGAGSSMSYQYSADGKTRTTIQSLPDGQSMTSVSESSTIASVALQGLTIAPAQKVASRVNGILTSESYRSVDGRLAGSISFGRENVSQSSVPVDGAWTTTIISPAGVQSRSFYEDGLMVAAVSYASGAALPAAAPADITTVVDTGFITGNSATYDAFGRVLTQTDARTGTTTMGTYLENSALLSLTDSGNRTSSFTYDVMGRRLTVDAPDTILSDGNTLSNITHTSYTARSQVRATWGDQTYPRFYVYDSQGRMSELHTWQGNPNISQATTTLPSGSAKTQWH